MRAGAGIAMILMPVTHSTSVLCFVRRMPAIVLLLGGRMYCLFALAPSSSSDIRTAPTAYMLRCWSLPSSCSHDRCALGSNPVWHLHQSIWESK
jgi:hypothetical protein